MLHDGQVSSAHHMLPIRGTTAYGSAITQVEIPSETNPGPVGGFCLPCCCTGRDFKASDLGRLPLLSAVIKETLRLCAPAPFGSTRHVADKDGAELCGFHVPKVCWLHLMSYVAGFQQVGPGRSFST